MAVIRRAPGLSYQVGGRTIIPLDIGIILQAQNPDADTARDTMRARLTAEPGLYQALPALLPPLAFDDAASGRSSRRLP